MKIVANIEKERKAKAKAKIISRFNFRLGMTYLIFLGV